MKNIKLNGLEYFKFEKFGFNNLSQGFFTRNGGISPEPWNSLNLSTTGGDSRENVIENRKRIFDCINRDVNSLYDTWQVHGTKILNISSPRELDKQPLKVDGIVTDNPQVTLMMRFADCVPILIYDPEKKIIGLIHAGWKGTVNNIVSKAVAICLEKYGCEPGNLVAGIGPCICHEHYIIREDVAKEVRKAFKIQSMEVLNTKFDGIHFDLIMANRILLERSGVKNIEESGMCTACDTGSWFSHRAEHGSTGRFGAFITLG